LCHLNEKQINLRIKLLSRDRQHMQCVSECFVNFCHDDIVENVNWGPRKIPILKNKNAEAVNSTRFEDFELKAVLYCTA